MAGLLLFGWVLVACSNAVPTSIAATQRPTQLTPAPPLATETIRPSETPSPSPSPTITSTGEVTLAAVGDLMLGRSVGEQILEKGPEVVFGGGKILFSFFAEERVDFRQMIKLAPGVSPASTSVNGMRTRSNSFLLDGQDSFYPSTGGLLQPLNNPDIIAEVRIVTNQFLDPSIGL